MPYFYDFNRNSTSNGTAATETTHLWSKTAANQETLGLYGIYGSMRYLTAGGASLRWKENLSSTGGMPTGGSSNAVNPKNRRGNPAAQSIWSNDGSAITASTGAATGERLAVGLAQTGGMGGYVPIVPTAALQMMPSSTTLFNPASWEMTSIAASTSISFDWTIDLGEGI